MSAPSLILLLTNAGLSVHLAHKKGADTLFESPGAPDELDALRTLARSWQSANFHLLTDLAEEDFQYESVPHLAGADQRALFTRKLDQAYRLTPYRRIAIQTKAKRGGQDKLMLSALTVRDRIDSIVNVLLEEKCALVGIHSVALATSELLHRLQLQLPHLLLISRTESGSLRQSYFNAADLRFSRLGSSQAGCDVALSAAESAEETRRARQYLTTLRLMNRDESLDVVLLTNADESPQLADHFIRELRADAPQIRAGTETVIAMAARLGMPATCADWKTLLFIAIARGLIHDHYRPVQAGRYHLLRRLGHAITASAVIIALIGGVLGWQGYVEAAHLQESIDQTNRNLRKEAARKKELDGKTKTMTADQPTAMKEAVELHNKYLAQWPDVDPTAQAISQILADFPFLDIERFSWRAQNSPAVLADADVAVQAAAQDASNPASDGPRWQIVELSGQIDQFNENYRESLGQIDRLMARLGKLPRTTATLSKPLLDIRPQGSINRQESTTAPSAFTLRIVIAPKEGA